jgi:hypothetical protein
MICAAERRPPSSEYLLKLDQPPISNPTTVMPPIAKKYRSPRLKSWPYSPGAKGSTRALRAAAAKTTTGAHVNTTASARDGVKSSFMSTFSPCTVDRSEPHGPTRSGPIRRFMRAMIFISM